MPDPIIQFARIVKKSHSLYLSMPRYVLREVGLKAGDILVVCAFEGDIILRKLRREEITDAMRGAVLRRREPHGGKTVKGPWSNPHGEKAGA